MGHNFVLAILFIVVGIPVICNTLVKLIHGPKELRKDKRDRMNRQEKEKMDRDSEMLEEIYYGLKDLGKRVENLETIMDDQGE